MDTRKRGVESLPASPRTRGWTRFIGLERLDPSVAASPRTRGWTQSGASDTVPAEYGFPAHAGMDLKLRASQSPVKVAGYPSAASPRTRGWTGFPAHAGMRPFTPQHGGQKCQASPRTRGWTRNVSRERLPFHGFPAHAGMDPRPCGAESTNPGFPAHAGMDP